MLRQAFRGLPAFAAIGIIIVVVLAALTVRSIRSPIRRTTKRMLRP
jgi:peptidoglycan/LPS O-acetylase OafA/YrhL